MSTPASPETRRYRGAVIGAGGTARQSHLPALLTAAGLRDRVEIVAVVDSAADLARRRPPAAVGAGAARRPGTARLHRHLHTDGLASRPHPVGPRAGLPRRVREARGAHAGGSGPHRHGGPRAPQDRNAVPSVPLQSGVAEGAGMAA